MSNGKEGQPENEENPLKKKRVREKKPRPGSPVIPSSFFPKKLTPEILAEYGITDPADVQYWIRNYARKDNPQAELLKNITITSKQLGNMPLQNRRGYERPYNDDPVVPKALYRRLTGRKDPEK